MILVVEDNANARQLLIRILSGIGHRIMEADDGDEALRLLDTHQFDLVITDLALPHTTGFGIIHHVREKWPRLPVILVTGYLSEHAAKTVLDERVEFIPKPIDQNRLSEAVDRFLTSQP
jgi:CheY-like chemotaxis protein